jgi:multidrug transporter EmrE-like cation transporter
MTKWILLSIALVLNASANVLLKIGSKTAGPLSASAGFWAKATNFLNLATVVGIGLFACNVLVYRKALDSLNISVAYPIMVSAGLVLVALAAAALPVLKERISPGQIVGMILIAAGVWLVARGGEV